MEKIRFSYQNALNFMRSEEISQIESQLKLSHEMLHKKTGAGADFLGWVDLPKNYDKEEFNRLKMAGDKIKKDSDILLVVGIGGSYLGARAAIEALTHTFSQSLSKEQRKTPQIFFVGQNISGTYLSDLLDILDGKDYSINVISKSGTTTEPALAFRVLKNHIEKKYGKEEARKRIYATTDREKGALKKLATEEGYETFVIPDDVGGRFSVITPVGLLPIYVGGVDIDELMSGVLDAYEDLKEPTLENISFQYAAVRNLLHRKGKTIELLVNYEPKLHYVSEWWKQLFGESEGKDGKGIFPGSVDFSTDLHSMGQYIQEGQRILFETTIHVESVERDIKIEKELEDLDGLNYLEGKDFAFVNKKAAQGTILAHIDGGVPNLEITIPKLSPYYVGYLFYFFMKSCGISGYLLGVNPFDQPGVEAYKKNMFALLGKKGFEELSHELNKRLKK